MKTLQDKVLRIVSYTFILGFTIGAAICVIGLLIVIFSTSCYAATEADLKNVDWSGYSTEDVHRILSEDITEESLMTDKQKQRCLIGDMADFYKDFDKRSVGIKYEALCAISALETGYFSSDACRNLNNVGGITGNNGYASYSTREEGIEALSDLLTDYYLDPDGCYFEGSTILDVSKHYNQSAHWISLYVKIRLDMEKRSEYNHTKALKKFEEEREKPELEVIKLPCINPVSIEGVHKDMFAVNERVYIA